MLLALLVAGCAPATPASRTVTLFHETHTHGLIREDGATFAHYAGLIDERRAALAHGSLFVGNGDDLEPWAVTRTASGPGPLSGPPRGVVEAFNASSLDANTFGFSELDLGPAELKALVKASRFTWVSANVLDPRTNDAFGAEEGARRWLVRDVRGLRVGITGAISAGAMSTSFGFPARVLPPSDALAEVVPALRRAGAELVVVLSHLTDEEVDDLARRVEGIDAILGSHVGIFGTSYEVGRTIVAAGRNHLVAIGELELTLGPRGVVEHRFRLHEPSRGGAVDPEVASVVERYARGR
jgi:2',3'-cyclic-nucleotide 2'-phosphodiesterase (5'-nucleotidase family)